MKDSASATRRPRRLLRWLAGALAVAAILALIYRAELMGLWRIANLFDPDRIVHNFQHMDEIQGSRTIERGDEVLEFARGTYSLPESLLSVLVK